MNIKKIIVICVLVLILLTIIVLVSCGGDDMHPENALNNFLEIIENKQIDDLSLSIFYISPSILTRAPLTIDNLVNFNGVEKTVVSGSDLEEYIYLFKQICSDDLIQVKNKSRINARFYYVFETVDEGKILDVAMWGNDSSIFINGFEVKENDIFYDAVMPFLSENGCKVLESYLGRSE